MRAEDCGFAGGLLSCKPEPDVLSGMTPFSRVDVSDLESAYVRQALASGSLRGGGAFARRCEQSLSASLGGARVLLTSSCTHALEMAAMLLAVQPGDEVICPSWTFASTANAFVLRGARIVFVDVEPATMTLDLAAVAAAITPRTVGVVPVHYAGFSCDMVALTALAARHRLWVVEDAAQALHATAHGRPLGTFGALGTFSFHETKNLTSGGEGGALVINDPALVARAELIREKGTDRDRYVRGEVSRYHWLEAGSSYLMSELQAAFLLAQLERADAIHASRHQAWAYYQQAFGARDRAGLIARPAPPDWLTHNAHIWFLRLLEPARRDPLLAWCRDRGIQLATHYEPLHVSPAGRRFGEFRGNAGGTLAGSESLVRLPLWSGMEAARLEHVVAVIDAFLG